MRKLGIATLTGTLALGCLAPRSEQPVVDSGRATQAVGTKTRTAASPTAARKLPPIEPLKGVVLLKGEARVLNAPFPDAEGAPIDSSSAIGHAFPLRSGRPVPIVGKAGRYYVIPSGEGAESCGKKGMLLPDFAVTLYVHEDDLLPVLVRPLQWTGALGTSARFEAGAPLGEPGGARPGAHFRTIETEPLKMTFLVRDDAVGLVIPPKRSETPPLSPNATLGAPCTQHHGGCWMGFVGEAFATLTGWTDVRKVEPRDDNRVLVELGGPCVRARAEVFANDLRPIPSNRSMSGYGCGCGGFVVGQDFDVAGNTTVYWRDGRIAGRVKQPLSLHRHLSTMVDGRRCFRRHPTERYAHNSDAELLNVCFDPSALSALEAPP
jgi:hypothetical protein